METTSTRCCIYRRLVAMELEYDINDGDDADDEAPSEEDKVDSKGGFLEQEKAKRAPKLPMLHQSLYDVGIRIAYKKTMTIAQSLALRKYHNRVLQ